MGLPNTFPPLDPKLALGYDGTQVRAILVDVTGKIIVNVPALPLPAGAATLAEQQTQTTSLQLIDDLRNALASVSTDALCAIGGWNGATRVPFLTDLAMHPQVDVLTSGLPTGAATSANQATMITALQLIDDLRNALASVGADALCVFPGWDGVSRVPLLTDAAMHAQVDVLSSALPSGAATAALQAGVSTSAKQDTMITALQLIDDLRGALASVATDSLLAHGHNSFNNVIPGYNDRWCESWSDLAPLIGPVTVNFTAVPAGEVWVLQNVYAFNGTTGGKIVKVALVLAGGALPYRIFSGTQGAGVILGLETHGEWWLKEGDYVRLIFHDNVAGNDLYCGVSGYKMKVA